MSEQDEIQQEIERKGLTAPRVTPADVENEIAAEQFIRATGCLTICVLTLKNGFTVVGDSACASPENFNAELGQKIARNDATQKIWPLLGFRLRDRLPPPTQRVSVSGLDAHGSMGADR